MTAVSAGANPAPATKNSSGKVKFDIHYLLFLAGQYAPR
jgi:hypothetical protein